MWFARLDLRLPVWLDGHGGVGADFKVNAGLRLVWGGFGLDLMFVDVVAWATAEQDVARLAHFQSHEICRPAS